MYNNSTSSIHPIIDKSLKNLFRHDVKHHGNRFNLFCDNFAQFGVAFPSLTPIGIGATCPRSMLSTYEVSNPTLQFHFIENGTTIALQRQQLECQPWLTSEESIIPINNSLLEVKSEHVFKNERSIVSRFSFTNVGDEIINFQPAWCGRIVGEQELYMIPYFHGAEQLPRTPFLEKVENGIFGGLKVLRADHDMPEIAIRLRCFNAELNIEKTTNTSYTFSSKQAIHLLAGETITIQFLLEVCMKNADKKGFEFPENENISENNFDELCSIARQRFATNINIEKAPAVKSPALTLKAWRSRLALLRNGLRGLDGEFGDQFACLCTADNTDFSCVFFWDTLFSSVAISDFNQEYAKGAIRTAFVRMNERDGSSPERKFNYSPKGRMSQQSPQSPVASWALLEYLKQYDDGEFLAEMFPILVRNHEFWEKYSDTDRDGLAEYRWSGQVADNSPLWDQYAASDPVTGCGYIPPVASVALNSFLYWDATNLVKLAEKLGLKEDASRFRARALKIQSDLFKICYLPDEKRFWDYNHHTGLHRRVNTFYMFWPLFAGMNVPAETVKDLIENVLLDSEQFFGEIPFPSVAYNEPEYSAVGYWRGRSWPHISYWLLQTLVRYGYVNEAKEAAARIMVSYSRSAGFPENLATQPEHFEAAGFADYNWGAAAVYLIATEKYLEK